MRTGRAQSQDRCDHIRYVCICRSVSAMQVSCECNEAPTKEGSAILQLGDLPFHHNNVLACAVLTYTACDFRKFEVTSQNEQGIAGSPHLLDTANPRPK